MRDSDASLDGIGLSNGTQCDRRLIAADKFTDIDRSLQLESRSLRVFLLVAPAERSYLFSVYADDGTGGSRCALLGIHLLLTPVRRNLHCSQFPLFSTRYFTVRVAGHPRSPNVRLFPSQTRSMEYPRFKHPVPRCNEGSDSR